VERGERGIEWIDFFILKSYKYNIYDLFQIIPGATIGNVITPIKPTMNYMFFPYPSCSSNIKMNEN
jgi:hypothetical protein